MRLANELMGKRYAPQAALLLATRPLDREADRAARLVDAVARNFSPSAPMTFRMVSNPGLRSPESALYVLRKEGRSEFQHLQQQRVTIR
jgi:hypothetical protein